ncbi:hypothetical protein L0152_07450 [bacterium]|nr:hypothetical protein [bacterium]
MKRFWVFLIAILLIASSASFAQQETVGVSDECEVTLAKNQIETKTLIGSIEFFLKDSSGDLIEYRHIKNVITNTGKAEAAGLLGATTTGAFGWIAIGTGTTAAAAADTALEAEISTGGGARADSTESRVTTTVTNDTAQFEVTFNFTSSFAVTESGVFDAASAGVILARRVFSAVNVSSGDSLTVRWKVAVS